MRAPVEHALRWTVALLTLFFFCTLPLTRAQNRGSGSTSAGVLLTQSPQQADNKSQGCISCHTATESASMHPTATVQLGCADCHGGNAGIVLPVGTTRESAAYDDAKTRAHVQPRYGENARSAANPVRAYTAWMRESAEFIQFVNPGDLRVAARTCGTSGCHMAEVQKVRSGMMTHGAMLWGAALYNNGSFPVKTYQFGEFYTRDGQPGKAIADPPPSARETARQGVLPFLEPL